MMRKTYTYAADLTFVREGIFEDVEPKNHAGNARHFGPINTLLITGDAGDNVLVGTTGDDVIAGFGGNDFLVGDAGNDVLGGGDGNDVLLGGAGADDLDGGAGNDLVSYVGASEGATVNLSNDAANAGSAKGDRILDVENVTGSAYGDKITGNSQDNVISGADGNDTLEGGGGKDKLDGGDGIDSVTYADAGAGVIANLAIQKGQLGDAEGDTYIGIENIGGSQFDDELIGDAGDNALSGGKGNDVLEGGVGNDTLDGGEGVDWAMYTSAGSGISVDLTDSSKNGGAAAGDILISIESVAGTAYDDIITGDASANRLDGGNGNDVLTGGAGADELDGGESGFDVASYSDASGGVIVNLVDRTKNAGDAAGDVHRGIEGLEGSSFGDSLTGDDGDNRLLGLAGNDTLIGGKGNDYFDGGLGADMIDGGEGAADLVNYSSSDIGVRVDLVDSRNNAGGALGDIIKNIEIVYGSSKDDVMIGDAAANTFHGGLGNDRFDGGAGAAGDAFYGDGDLDTVTYVSSTTGVTVNLKDITKNAGDAKNDTYNMIEIFEGSNFDDTLVAATGGSELHGLAGKDNLMGDAGNDHLYGDADADILTGGDGADTLVGGAGADALDGGAGMDDHASYEDATTGITLDLINAALSTGDAKGDTFADIEIYEGSNFNDTMRGTTGADSFFGGKGDDLLSGGSGDDYLDGGDGKDWLEGGDGKDNLLGNAGDDTLVGRLGDDLLMGGYGKDSLYGSEGQDVINGDTGDDMLVGGDGDDTLNGGSDNDTVYGSTGNDIVSGDDGNDQLSGGTGMDKLAGGSGDDKLYGNEDNDMLYGGDGKDLLFGGQGHDVLTGDKDADTFVLRVGDNTAKVLSGADLITDYHDGEDKIGLADSLGFSDLVFTQSGADTVITNKAGEYLAVVQNTTTTQFEATDFVHVV